GQRRSAWHTDFLAAGGAGGRRGAAAVQTGRRRAPGNRAAPAAPPSNGLKPRHANAPQPKALHANTLWRDSIPPQQRAANPRSAERRLADEPTRGVPWAAACSAEITKSGAVTGISARSHRRRT